MSSNLELDIIARPIAEKIAAYFNPVPIRGAVLDLNKPYRKINPREVSKLLPGWYVTAYDEDGNEIEIHIQTYRRSELQGVF